LILVETFTELIFGVRITLHSATLAEQAPHEIFRKKKDEDMFIVEEFSYPAEFCF